MTKRTLQEQNNLVNSLRREFMARFEHEGLSFLEIFALCDAMFFEAILHAAKEVEMQAGEVDILKAKIIELLEHRDKQLRGELERLEEILKETTVVHAPSCH